jgi:bidirectional [NiFe] hydrogenase diaphorase subunit
VASISVTIDGVDVQAEVGETIMGVAARAGIRVPGLCQLDGLSVHGACRLCMVEIVGSVRPRPACATPAVEAMEIRTTSSRLRAHRKVLLEMLFAEGRHVCSVCVASGACELQELAAEYGVDHAAFKPPAVRTDLDLSHERFGYDPNRCVLCTRCVRTCAEIEGAVTWGVAGRGRESHLVADLGEPWGESLTCTSCGKCVSACPTGALFEKGTSVGERRVDRSLVPALAERRRRAALEGTS